MDILPENGKNNQWKVFKSLKYKFGNEFKKTKKILRTS